MELLVSNVGKISQASIKIEGMTVIAGENNTGKSTIGKTLFAFFNGMYQLDNAIVQVRIESITNAMRRYTTDEYDTDYFYFPPRLRKQQNSELEDLVADIALRKEMPGEDFETILRIISCRVENYKGNRPVMETVDRKTDSNNSEENRERLESSIQKALVIPDEEIIGRILTSYFYEEFNGQINNVFTKNAAAVKLRIKSSTPSVEIEENSIKSFVNIDSLSTQAVYIDDPFIVDEHARMSNWGQQDHRSILKNQLFNRDHTNIIDQIVVDQKMDEVFKKVNAITGGALILSKRQSFVYQPLNTKDSISTKNISSGLKPFLIIKKLLENGVLQENGVLILDEPEIHLHPEWQIVLAELIVLIQKEYSMHVLLTTHSPYFLYAVELFTGKYGMKETSHYYLAESHGEQTTLSDVSTNIDTIYKKLADPFQKLESLSYE